MRHRCYWPDCSRQVPAKLLMCVQHWRRVPQVLRHRIWDSYRDGQENNHDLISPEYLVAVRQATDWARDRVIKDRARAS